MPRRPGLDATYTRDIRKVLLEHNDGDLTNLVDLLEPYELGVQRGVYGDEAFIDVKFGSNRAAGTDWEVVSITGGLRPYRSADMSVAQQCGVSSDDPDDTDQGLGAWAVTVSGLDENGDLASDTVRLNGQTQVLTTVTFTRIFRAFVSEAAPQADNRGGAAIGFIYIGQGTPVGGVPPEICITIDNGNNQSQICALTVPRGYSAYIMSLAASTVKDKEFEFGLFTRDTQLENSVFRMNGNVAMYRFAWQQVLPYARIPELTDVEIRARNLGAGSDLVTATMVILYVRDDAVG